MRRALQEGHTPRPLQKNARSRSCPQSVVLLVGAALFGRSLQEALQTDLGIDTEGVAAATVRLRPHGVTMAEGVGVVDRMLDAARRHPTVTSVAYATHGPVGARQVALPFIPDEDEETRAGVPINVVTPEYFESLGIPLVHGRRFDERDAADAPLVIMVNEAAARQLWGDERPVGRLGRITFNREPATVIGVVGQTLYHDLTERDEPHVCYPLTQLPGPALSSGNLIARAISDQLDRVLATQRFGTTLLGLFSALALLIAGVGIYGVASWTVAAGRREIGIRMALGAKSQRVLTGVLGRTASATAAGALIGLAAAVVLTDLLEAFLYGVTPLDRNAFFAALLALVFASVIATWIPARRAIRIDPAETMRTE
ncbi:MAG: FtsX-like permease family protein [Gemmatimonadota bacterium]